MSLVCEFSSWNLVLPDTPKSKNTAPKTACCLPFFPQRNPIFWESTDPIFAVRLLDSVRFSGVFQGWIFPKIPWETQCSRCQGASLTTLRAELCCCNLRGAAMDAEPAWCIVVYRGQSCEMTGRLGPLTREIRVLPKNYHTLRHSLGCFDHSLHSKILGFRVKFPFSQSLVDVHLTYLSYLLYFTLLLVVFLPIFLSFHIPNPRLVQGPPPPLARLVRLVRWVHLREAPRLNIT